MRAAGTLFTISSGMLAPEHHGRMKGTVWVFLWSVDRQTNKRGEVKGGQPVPAKWIAADLGISEKTVLRHLTHLEREGYLKLKRSSHGVVIEVQNPKKWFRRDRTEMSTLDRTKVPFLLNENGQSCPSDRTGLSDHRPYIGSTKQLQSSITPPEQIPLQNPNPIAGKKPASEPEIDRDFERLEALYPNPRGVDNACHLWISLKGTGELNPETIPEVFAGLERWRDSEEWAKEDGKYIPKMDNWVSKRRWRDHPKLRADLSQPERVSSEGNDPYAVYVPPHRDEHGNLRPEFEGYGGFTDDELAEAEQQLRGRVN